MAAFLVLSTGLSSWKFSICIRTIHSLGDISIAFRVSIMHCLLLHFLLRAGNRQAWPESCCGPRGIWVAATTYWGLTLCPFSVWAFDAFPYIFLKPRLRGFYGLPPFINIETNSERKSNLSKVTQLKLAELRFILKSDSKTFCYTTSHIGSFQSEMNCIWQFSTLKIKLPDQPNCSFGWTRNDYLKEARCRQEFKKRGFYYLYW